MQWNGTFDSGWAGFSFLFRTFLHCSCRGSLHGLSYKVRAQADLSTESGLPGLNGGVNCARKSRSREAVLVDWWLPLMPGLKITVHLTANQTAKGRGPGRKIDPLLLSITGDAQCPAASSIRGVKLHTQYTIFQCQATAAGMRNQPTDEDGQKRELV